VRAGGCILEATVLESSDEGLRLDVREFAKAKRG